MAGIKILGTGSYLPPKIASNEDFTKFLDTSDEWITTRTGIKERRVSTGEPTWYMATQASLEAIKAAGINVSDIGLIIVTSVSPDYQTPSSACIVQSKLGARGCMAIDINCACSAFAYGVDMAKRYLQSDRTLKYVLVISAENLTRLIDYKDRSTCILFGDGASAVVMEYSDNMYTSHLGADGDGGKYLYAKHFPPMNAFMPENPENYEIDIPKSDDYFLHQDGREVYKFAIKALPMAVRKAAEKINLDINDIDVFVPHQANVRIIQTAADNLGVSMDKFYLVIEKFGNTSSASIPLAFDEAVRTGRIKRGDKVCFVGFGAGLTYGAVIFEY